MILLKLLSWQYARKHMLRSLLTTAGIVIGVAVFVGMHIANGSVLNAFNQTVDHIAGKTQLQVSAGEPGFDEEVLEKVQSVREVRVAAPVIEAVVDTGLKSEGNLMILAVDMTGDSSLRDYDLEGAADEVVDDMLVFLAQADSLILTREFAARNGLRVDSKIAMQTMEGPKLFTVRGLLRSGGMAQAFGGNIAIMDIYAAQKVFGRGRKFDRIDVALKDGVTLPQGRAAIARLLGTGFSVEPPSGRGQQFESLLRVYSVGMNVSSVFALFIGMFIIYNSFAIAVTERRAEIGILRALGATRAQTRVLFLGESAIAGLFGSLLGIVCGIAVAGSMASLTSSLVENAFGVAQKAERLLIEPRLVFVALAIGLVTSMIAGWLPARNAARVDPVQALQKGKYQVLSAGENRIRRFIATVAAAISLLCLLFAKWSVFFYGGYLLLVIAALLLTPSLAVILARVLRAPLKRLRPVEGVLAADSLIQAPRRTSATVAALMLALGMVISMGGLARASYTSIEEWMIGTLNPDLFVSTTQTLVSRSFHFPASMVEELSSLPGVDQVQSVRTTRFNLNGKQVMLIAIPILRVAQKTKGRRVVAGDYDEMHRLAGAGKGLIASENLVELQHLKLGDVVEISTPEGMLRLPVAGIIQDFSNQEGCLFIDRSVYMKYWRDDTIDIFRVYVQPGAQPMDVKRAINERFGGRRRLFVLSNPEIKEYVLKLTNQWFSMTYVQIAVAVLVAVLGIVNTLTVSIADRRRELGVLRAVGGLRQQIRRTVWLEAIAVGSIGLLLGIALGALTLSYQLEMVRRDVVGLRLAYEFPLGVAAALVPTILLAAFVAALGPAESAVRSSLVEALEYE